MNGLVQGAQILVTGPGNLICKTSIKIISSK